MSHRFFSLPKSKVKIYFGCGIVCLACAVGGLLAFRLTGTMVGPAAAQSDHQPFGRYVSLLPMLGPMNSTPPVQSVKPPVTAKIISYAAPTALPSAGERSEPEAGEDRSSADVDDWASYEAWTPGRSDTFRTVCVRLCDGAYHPISFSTTRDRFKLDAKRCQAGCEQPSRLFIVKPEGSVEEMVDVRGGSYVDLPNAFKFQTAYDAACTCHSHPWEAKSKEQHRRFAEAGAQSKAGVIPSSEQLQSSLATTTRPQTVSLPQAALVTQTSQNAVVIAADGAPSRILPPTPPLISSSSRLALADPSISDSPPSAIATRAVLGSTLPVPSQGEVKRHEPIDVSDGKHVVARKRVGKRSLPAQAFEQKGATETGSVGKKQRSLGPTVVVLRPAPVQKPVRMASATSLQRPFKSAEYWRLSFWETKN